MKKFIQTIKGFFAKPDVNGELPSDESEFNNWIKENYYEYRKGSGQYSEKGGSKFFTENINELREIFKRGNFR